MAVVIAGGALLLDVRDLAIGGDLAIVACHASTGECREAEETNKTHHAESLEPTSSKSCTATCAAEKMLDSVLLSC
jgi:hypothetical protein